MLTLLRSIRKLRSSHTRSSITCHPASPPTWCWTRLLQQYCTKSTSQPKQSQVLTSHSSPTVLATACIRTRRSSHESQGSVVALVYRRIHKRMQQKASPELSWSARGFCSAPRGRPHALARFPSMFVSSAELCHSQGVLSFLSIPVRCGAGAIPQILQGRDGGFQLRPLPTTTLPRGSALVSFRLKLASRRDTGGRIFDQIPSCLVRSPSPSRAQVVASQCWHRPWAAAIVDFTAPCSLLPTGTD